MELSIALERFKSVTAQQGETRIAVVPWKEPGTLMLQISYTEPEEHDLMMRVHHAQTLGEAEAWLLRRGLAADAEWEMG